MNNELQALVEQYGMFAVLDYLSGICGRKAEAAKSFFDKDDWTAAEEACNVAASKMLDLFQERGKEI